MVQLAGCVITNSHGEVLLLHRRQPGRVQWELPGGKVEEGETVAQAAIREVKEELGVEVAIQELVGSTTFSQGDVSYQYSWYQGVIEEGEPVIGEPQLHDKLSYIDLESIDAELLSPNVRNLCAELRTGRLKLSL